MKFSIREWRPAHLFGAWVTYWALLAGVTLARPIQLLLRLRGSDLHGSASAHFDNGVFTAHVGVGDAVWDASVHLGTMFGWLAGPPLVIWLVFMATRPSRTTAYAIPAPAVDAVPSPALDRGDVPPEFPSGERRGGERARVR